MSKTSQILLEHLLSQKSEMFKNGSETDALLDVFPDILLSMTLLQFID